VDFYSLLAVVGTAEEHRLCGSVRCRWENNGTNRKWLHECGWKVTQCGKTCVH